MQIFNTEGLSTEELKLLIRMTSRLMSVTRDPEFRDIEDTIDDFDEKLDQEWRRLNRVKSELKKPKNT